jgi:hypothetical protein
MVPTQIPSQNSRTFPGLFKNTISQVSRTRGNYVDNMEDAYLCYDVSIFTTDMLLIILNILFPAGNMLALQRNRTLRCRRKR